MVELIFAILLAAAGALIVVGVAMVTTAGALIVGGALLAGWSWLVLGDVT